MKGRKILRLFVYVNKKIVLLRPHLDTPTKTMGVCDTPLLNRKP